MAKIRCPRCGERNDVSNTECLYCDTKLPLTPRVEQIKMNDFVALIKKRKFYISAVVILGITLISAVSLLIWRPGIARGEYSLNDVMKMLAGQEIRIDKIEPKITPKTPSVQTTPTPTTPVKSSTNSEANIVPKPSGNGDFHVSEVCTEIAIPYETDYHDDSSMYIGDTRVAITGTNGVRKDCTKTYDGKDWAQYYGLTYKDVRDEVWPRTALVYKGTKPIATTPTTPTYTYEQALQIARNTGTCMQIAQASGTGSSAYQQCLSLVMKDYGYEYRF